MDINGMKKGFTLIEIMVVIAILGVLIAMVSGSFVSSQKKSRDLKRKSDLSQIGKALEFYYNDRGQYPLSDNGKIVGCGDPTTALVDCVAGGEWANTTTTPQTIYMAQLPSDPTGQRYFYDSDGNGTYYKLYARLENTDDGQIGTYATICSGTDGQCNYGLSSPNTKP
jgi:type II secretion system protein G